MINFTPISITIEKMWIIESVDFNKLKGLSIILIFLYLYPYAILSSIYGLNKELRSRCFPIKISNDSTVKIDSSFLWNKWNIEVTSNKKYLLYGIEKYEEKNKRFHLRARTTKYLWHYLLGRGKNIIDCVISREK